MFQYLGHMYVKITTKCHNRKVQLSRGIKRRRDEQIKKKMPHMKPHMYKELQQRNHLAMVRRKTSGGLEGEGGLNQFYLLKTTSLILMHLQDKYQYFLIETLDLSEGFNKTGFDISCKLFPNRIIFYNSAWHSRFKKNPLLRLLLM